VLSCIFQRHWLAVAVAPNASAGDVSGVSSSDCARHGCNRYPTPKTVSMYASPGVEYWQRSGLHLSCAGLNGKDATTVGLR
jgi:hypothetical protein